MILPAYHERSGQIPLRQDSQVGVLGALTERMSCAMNCRVVPVNNEHPAYSRQEMAFSVFGC